MAKVVKDLIGKLDREEITNLQCITMHGQEMVDDYKEWCQVLGFDEERNSSSTSFAMVMSLMITTGHKKCGIKSTRFPMRRWKMLI